MAETQYALLKDNIVVNVVIIDDDTPDETKQLIAESNGATHFLSCSQYGETQIGGTFDGTRLWAKQPFPSWTKNEEEWSWQAPTPMPPYDKFYYWDESALRWVEGE